MSRGDTITIPCSTYIAVYHSVLQPTLRPSNRRSISHLSVLRRCRSPFGTWVMLYLTGDKYILLGQDLFLVLHFCTFRFLLLLWSRLPIVWLNAGMCNHVGFLPRSGAMAIVGMGGLRATGVLEFLIPNSLLLPSFLVFFTPFSHVVFLLLLLSSPKRCR